MRRILIVYNKRSSQFADVKREVLAPARKLKGFMLGKYEVEPTDVDKNAAKLAKILEDGDILITAGGDATATIGVNGIMQSGKKVMLGVLPYGNFNDLANTLRVKNFTEMLRLIENGFEEKRLYPLMSLIDGEFFRYGACYVTIGLTAAAVEIYDAPKVRGGLRKGWFGRKIGSYTAIMGWYFKNRKKKDYLPEFKLNGKLVRKGTSDYAAVNGRRMARVMKGGDDFLRPKVFRSMTERTVKFPALFWLLFKSILVRTPGEETEKDILEFVKPSTVALQAEGEYRTFEKIKKIEIKKSSKYIRIISK